MNPEPIKVSFISPNFLTKGPISPPCTIIAITPTATRVPLDAFVVHLRDSWRKNIKIFVSPVKAIKYIKKAKDNFLIFSSLNTLNNCFKGFFKICFD